MSYDKRIDEIRERLKSRKAPEREDYGVKGMKWGEHKAEEEETGNSKPKSGTGSARKGTMGDEDIRNNILAEIRNKSENKGAAKQALSDLRPGDSVSLEAKTYKGNVYKTTITAKDDGSFEVRQTIKGQAGKPEQMNLADATEELLYFKSRTGGSLDKVDIGRAKQSATAQQNKASRLGKLPEWRQRAVKQGLRDGNTYTFAQAYLDLYPEEAEKAGFDLSEAQNRYKSWIDYNDGIFTFRRPNGDKDFFDAEMNFKGTKKY